MQIDRRQFLITATAAGFCFLPAPAALFAAAPPTRPAGWTPFAVLRDIELWTMTPRSGARSKLRDAVKAGDIVWLDEKKPVSIERSALQGWLHHLESGDKLILNVESDFEPVLRLHDFIPALTTGPEPYLSRMPPAWWRAKFCEAALAG